MTHLLQSQPHSDLVTWDDLYLEHLQPGETKFKAVTSEKDAEKSPDVLSTHRVPLEFVNGTLDSSQAQELDTLLNNLNVN